MGNDSKEWREIREVKDLMDLKIKGIGFIVITDKSNPDRIHHPSCNHVKVESFEEKVITNKCGMGHYYWTADRGLAKEKWQTEECAFCIK